MSSMPEQVVGRITQLTHDKVVEDLKKINLSSKKACRRAMAKEAVCDGVSTEQLEAYAKVGGLKMLLAEWLKEQG